MARHRALAEIEDQPDTPWNPHRAYPRRGGTCAPGTGPDDHPIGQYRTCWCGQPMGHDWPGKADKAPHPQEGRDG